MCPSPRATSSGVPVGDDAAAVRAALGAEVDEAVGGAHDVEVVLDDEHGVPAVGEAAERAQQDGDVLEVQARRRLVEDVEAGARTRGSSARAAARRRRCASPLESVVSDCPRRR